MPTGQTGLQWGRRVVFILNDSHARLHIEIHDASLYGAKEILQQMLYQSGWPDTSHTNRVYIWMIDDTHYKRQPPCILMQAGTVGHFACPWPSLTIGVRNM